jgi:hypothetical protein
MKPFFTFLLILVCASHYAQQPLIAVKGPETDAIATTLQQAIDLALPHDKIYLPGGNYQLTDSIQKPVHIIGTGYNETIPRLLPVSYLPNNILIGSQADGLILEGVKANSIIVRTNNVSIRKVHAKIIDCKNNTLNVINTYVWETLNGGNNATIRNSIIQNVYFTHNSHVKNSIIIYSYFWGTSGATNNLFTDCVFRGITNVTYGNNQLINCLHANSSDVTFNSYFNNSKNNVFDLTSDLSMSSTAPIQNTGIYHGESPWKEGGQPVNPHIEQNNSFLDVQTEQFKLRIKVIPQTN